MNFEYQEKGIVYICNCDSKLRPIIIINTLKMDISKVI